MLGGQGTSTSLLQGHCGTLPKSRSFWGSILGPYYLGDPGRDQKFDNLTSHGHTVLPKAAIMAAAVWAFALGL